MQERSYLRKVHFEKNEDENLVFRNINSLEVFLH